MFSRLPRGFRFERLVVPGIRNDAVYRASSRRVEREEVCMVREGCDPRTTLSRLESRVVRAMDERRPLPVVRFADGEFAFYERDLACNGLYEQAASPQAIDTVLPRHFEALRRVAATGILAPLVFEMRRSVLRPVLSRRQARRSGLGFLRLLEENGVRLTDGNYVPFYLVYAFLTSTAFARALDGRRVALVNDAPDPAECQRWFAARGSRPRLSAVPVPASRLATDWHERREQTLAALPDELDLILVGAGIAALLVCDDLARARSVPVIDAGHVLNQMNDRVHKSAGPRLFTHWEDLPEEPARC